jgi:hypothetical protein
MSEIAGLFSLFIVIAALALGLAAIMMPIFVFLISERCSKIDRTLAKIEQLMRHGK